MNHTNHKVLLWSAGLLWAVTFGCRERIEPESPDYVEHGWELMAELDYRGAIPQFEEGAALDPTYADAFNGLGWAYAKLGSADTSAGHFITGEAKGDTSVVGTEVLAGLAFSKLALGEFDDAVTNGKEALVRDPNWVFEHDTDIYFDHLTLAIATGFYGSGEFDSSRVWVRQLDPTYDTDVTTLQGRYDLAAKLEEIRQSI